MIIELNSLADFKHYFITVDGFTEDINIKKGHNTYDGKSVLAVYNVAEHPFNVEIISNRPVRLNQFNEAMKQFEVKTI